MAKDKQHKGSPTDTSATRSTGRSGGSAQQEQGGNVSQQDGARPRDDAGMLDEGAQSGSSPRSRNDSPDEGKGGERT